MIKMKNILRLSAESGTNSKNKPLGKAIIRLTAYYTLVVFCILLLFSVVVYSLFSSEVSNRFDRTPSEMTTYELIDEDGDEENDSDYVHEIEENLINILFVTDIILLILTVFIAYVSARKILHPIEESYRRQERFVADASHELRTPLAVMKAGFETALRNERTTKEYQEYLSEALIEINNLTNLSNTLLSIAKAGIDTNLQMEKTNLSDICKKQKGFFEAYALQKQVNLDAHVQENVFINGQKVALLSVINNLLKNAIDYNVVSGKVTITLTDDKTHAVLNITDTGIGIPHNDLTRIFDAFFKSDKSRTQSNQATGSGLGLAIVKQIVDMHGGKCTVSSKEGVGTEFIIKFPLA